MKSTPSCPTASSYARTPFAKRLRRAGGLLGWLGKVWTAVNTVAVGAYGLLGIPSEGIDIGNNGIQFHGNLVQTLLSKIFLPPGRVGEFTGGNAIVYSRGQSPTTPLPSGTTLGAHAGAHTVQAQVLGPFYFPAHGIARGVSLFGGTNFLETGPDANPSRPWP